MPSNLIHLNSSLVPSEEVEALTFYERHTHAPTTVITILIKKKEEEEKKQYLIRRDI
jgi:hypothetical protein